MRYLTTLAFLAITIPVLAAPHGDGDCFCKGLLEPGMTVHTTVANPWGAANLDAGDCGMVACSNGIGDAVLVVWFNWYNGDPHAGDWCRCGHDDSSPGKGWWVSCDDIKPGCPPARGACCMQGECVWATRRVCDSRDGLYFGDGLSCEDVCDCGEGWQHEDIDADGDVDFQDFLRVIQGWGPRDGQRPDEDIDGDCVVGVEDLLRIFEHWGPPPPRGACCLNQACTIETEDDCTLGDAVGLFKSHGISQMPCTTDGRLSGVITEADVLHFLVDGRSSSTALARVMERKVHTVNADDSAKELPQTFERGEVAIVIDNERRVHAIITKMDYIELLSSRSKLAGMSLAD